MRTFAAAIHPGDLFLVRRRLAPSPESSSRAEETTAEVAGAHPPRSTLEPCSGEMDVVARPATSAVVAPDRFRGRWWPQAEGLKGARIRHERERQSTGELTSNGWMDARTHASSENPSKHRRRLGDPEYALWGLQAGWRFGRAGTVATLRPGVRSHRRVVRDDVRRAGDDQSRRDSCAASGSLIRTCRLATYIAVADHKGQSAEARPKAIGQCGGRCLWRGVLI